jgi:hypothetical protein
VTGVLIIRSYLFLTSWEYDKIRAFHCRRPVKFSAYRMELANVRTCWGVTFLWTIAVLAVRINKSGVLYHTDRRKQSLFNCGNVFLNRGRPHTPHFAFLHNGPPCHASALCTRGRVSHRRDAEDPLLCLAGSRYFTLHRASSHTNTNLNSVARVRERTIPTERPPLVSEVSANFCG